MTVKELIQRLSKVEQDEEIILYHLKDNNLEGMKFLMTL